MDDIRAQLEHHRRRVESFEKGNLWVAAIDNAELERRKQQWKSSANYAELESKGIFGMDLAQAKPILLSLGYEDAKGGRFIHADGDDAKHVRLQINQGKIVPEDKNPPKRGLRKKPLPSGKNALKVTPEVQKQLDGLPKGLKVKLEEIRLEGAASVADFNRAVDLTEKLASSPFDNHSVLKTLGAFHRQHGDDQTGPLAELQHAVDLVKEGRIADGTVAHLGAENKKGRPIDLGEKSQNKSVDLGGISEADVVFEAPDGTVHVHEVKATVSALVDKHGADLRKKPDFKTTQQGVGKQWEMRGKRKYEVHVKETSDCSALFSVEGRKAFRSFADEDVDVWLGREQFSGRRLKELAERLDKAPSPPPPIHSLEELMRWLKSP